MTGRHGANDVNQAFSFLSCWHKNTAFYEVRYNEWYYNSSAQDRRRPEKLALLQLQPADGLQERPAAANGTAPRTRSC